MADVMPQAVGQGFVGKMIYVLVASVVLIIAVASLGGNGKLSSHEAYAVSVGTISAVASVVSLVLLRFQPETMTKQMMTVKSKSFDVQGLVAIFLWVWWLFGTTIITFKAPFTVTSNGYFAAWVGLIASSSALVGAANLSVPDRTSAKGVKGAITGMLVSALVLLLAVSILQGDSKKAMPDESVFGVVSSCFTLVTCSVLLWVPTSVPQVAQKVLSILLVLLWMTTAGVLTFRDPFLITGNGYFACWSGFFFSSRLFSDLFLNQPSDEAAPAPPAATPADQTSQTPPSHVPKPDDFN